MLHSAPALQAQRNAIANSTANFSNSATNCPGSRIPFSRYSSRLRTLPSPGHSASPCSGAGGLFVLLDGALLLFVRADELLIRCLERLDGDLEPL